MSSEYYDKGKRGGLRMRGKFFASCVFLAILMLIIVVLNSFPVYNSVRRLTECGLCLNLPYKPVQDFVKIHNGEFVTLANDGSNGQPTSCQPFFPTGWNAWDISRAPRIYPKYHKTKGNITGRKALSRQLKTAAESGLNVVRAWAHTVDPEYPVMLSPGKYDERGLQALDFLLSEANKYGIRVILSFVDNWKYHGGVDQIVDWSSTAPKRLYPRPTDKLGDFTQKDMNETLKEYEVRRHALFYTDKGSEEIYMGHIKALLERKNFYNGKKYKDDPTILAWNLINEPRCENWLVNDCEKHLQSWIEKMSKFVKAHDKKHLLTVGSEGFWAEGSPNVKLNPASWAMSMGQDFTQNHSPTEIDFATVHIWPDNWEQPSTEFQAEWVERHIEEAESVLKKPVILQEFGKKMQSKIENKYQRNEVYDTIHGLVENSAQSKKMLKGSLFWNWELDLLVGAHRSLYSVKESDATFKLIEKHAKLMKTISEDNVFECHIDAPTH